MYNSNHTATALLFLVSCILLSVAGYHGYQLILNTGAALARMLGGL